MTADGGDDNLVNLEGVTQGMNSLMDVDITPEPPISSTPADEKHPPGSSNEDESNDEEERAGSDGERLLRDVNEMAILDIDDELADDEVLLPLQTPGGYSLVNLAPAALTAAQVKQSIMLRLCVGWLEGIILR